MDTDANEGACSLLVCKGCTSGAAGQSAQPLDDVAELFAAATASPAATASALLDARNRRYQ